MGRMGRIFVALYNDGLHTDSRHCNNMVYDGIRGAFFSYFSSLLYTSIMKRREHKSMCISK